MVNILVIDDQAANQDLTGSLLASLGHTVIAATGGEQAYQFAKHAQFDLVLVDLHMPNVDGMATAALFQADPDLHGLPLVSFTASATSGELDRASAAGFADRLGKPGEGGDFLTAVPALLRRLAAAAT